MNTSNISYQGLFNTLTGDFDTINTDDITCDTLEVSGTATIADLTISNNLTVNNEIIINNNLTVNGTTNLNGPVETILSHNSIVQTDGNGNLTASNNISENIVFTAVPGYGIPRLIVQDGGGNTVFLIGTNTPGGANSQVQFHSDVYLPLQNDSSLLQVNSLGFMSSSNTLPSGCSASSMSLSNPTITGFTDNEVIITNSSGQMIASNNLPSGCTIPTATLSNPSLTGTIATSLSPNDFVLTDASGNLKTSATLPSGLTLTNTTLAGTTTFSSTGDIAGTPIFTTPTQFNNALNVSSSGTIFVSGNSSFSTSNGVTLQYPANLHYSYPLNSALDLFQYFGNFVGSDSNTYSSLVVNKYPLTGYALSFVLGYNPISGTGASNYLMINYASGLTNGTIAINPNLSVLGSTSLQAVQINGIVTSSGNLGIDTPVTVYGNSSNQLQVTNSTGSNVLNCNASSFAVTTKDNTLDDGSGNIIGATINLDSSVQNTSRILLSGQEYYQAGNTSTNGVAILLGVNRSANRQIWFTDSALMSPSSSTVGCIRFTGLGSSSPVIDVVATNGTSALPLGICLSGQTVTFGGSIFSPMVVTSGSLGTSYDTYQQTLNYSFSSGVNNLIILNHSSSSLNQNTYFFVTVRAIWCQGAGSYQAYSQINSVGVLNSTTAISFIGSAPAFNMQVTTGSLISSTAWAINSNNLVLSFNAAYSGMCTFFVEYSGAQS